MISKAATAFDRTTHSPTALKKFWAGDPVAAAKWTVGVVKAAGVESKAVDKLEKVPGMNVCIHTSARTDDEGRALLTHLGVPFRAA